MGNKKKEKEIRISVVSFSPLLIGLFKVSKEENS